MNKLLTVKQKHLLRSLESKDRAYTKKINEILYFKKANPVIDYDDEVFLNTVLKELRSEREIIREKKANIYKEESIRQL